MKVSTKDLRILGSLLGRPAHITLMALSSEFSENDEAAFRDAFGCSSKAALATLERVRSALN